MNKLQRVDWVLLAYPPPFPTSLAVDGFHNPTKLFRTQRTSTCILCQISPRKMKMNESSTTLLLYRWVAAALTVYHHLPFSYSHWLCIITKKTDSVVARFVMVRKLFCIIFAFGSIQQPPPSPHQRDSTKPKGGMNFRFPIPSGTSGIQSHWGQRHTPVRGSYSQVSASNFSYDKLFHCFFGLAQARYVVGDGGRRQNARRMFCPGSFPIDDNDDDYMRPFGLVGFRFLHA